MSFLGEEVYTVYIRDQSMRICRTPAATEMPVCEEEHFAHVLCLRGYYVNITK
jgi:hypothetical protein